MHRSFLGNSHAASHSAANPPARAALLWYGAGPGREFSAKKRPNEVAVQLSGGVATLRQQGCSSHVRCNGAGGDGA